MKAEENVSSFCNLILLAIYHTQEGNDSYTIQKGSRWVILWKRLCVLYEENRQLYLDGLLYRDFVVHHHASKVLAFRRKVTMEYLQDIYHTSMSGKPKYHHQGKDVELVDQVNLFSSANIPYWRYFPCTTQSEECAISTLLQLTHPQPPPVESEKLKKLIRWTPENVEILRRIYTLWREEFPITSAQVSAKGILDVYKRQFLEKDPFQIRDLLRSMDKEIRNRLVFTVRKAVLYYKIATDHPNMVPTSSCSTSCEPRPLCFKRIKWSDSNLKILLDLSQKSKEIIRDIKFSASDVLLRYRQTFLCNDMDPWNIKDQPQDKLRDTIRQAYLYYRDVHPSTTDNVIAMTQEEHEPMIVEEVVADDSVSLTSDKTQEEHDHLSSTSDTTGGPLPPPINDTPRNGQVCPLFTYSISGPITHRNYMMGSVRLTQGTYLCIFQCFVYFEYLSTGTVSMRSYIGTSVDGDLSSTGVRGSAVWTGSNFTSVPDKENMLSNQQILHITESSAEVYFHINILSKPAGGTIRLNLGQDGTTTTASFAHWIRL